MNTLFNGLVRPNTLRERRVERTSRIEDDGFSNITSIVRFDAKNSHDSSEMSACFKQMCSVDNNDAKMKVDLDSVFRR